MGKKKSGFGFFYTFDDMLDIVIFTFFSLLESK